MSGKQGITINLTNDEIEAAQSTFEVLPAGVYAGIVYDAVLKKSKAGNDMYEINFKITHGQKGVGRKIRFWAVLASHALFSVIDLNKAVGFEYPTKDNVKDGEFTFAPADDYLGQKVNLVLVKEPYESVDEETGEDVVKFQNNVKRPLPFDLDKISEAKDEDEDDSNVFL